MWAQNLIKSYWPLMFVVIIGGILRFWRLEQLTTFSGDQGYDFLIVKRMLVEKDFTLLGPKIGPYNEIGNLYLGPAYYYLLAPALLIFALDPIGPAALTSMLAVFTIILIYLLAKKYISQQAAVISSALYATNAFLITQSKAASNPHLIPFFSIAFLYSFFEVLYAKNARLIWPIISGATLGIMFQLHYLSLSLSPLTLLFVYKKKIKEFFITLISFLVAVSPQILFELRNEFFITNLFIKQMEGGRNLSNAAMFWDNLGFSISKLLSIFYISPLLVAIGTFAIFIAILKYQAKSASVLLVLISAVITSIFSVSLYSGGIELHYFATAYAAIAIVLGAVFAYLFKLFSNILVRGILLILFLHIISASLLNLNLNADEGYTMPEGWNLRGTKKASKIIADDVSSSNFNIASTLDGDTRARPFRYLVEVYGKIPQDVEHYPDSQTIYLVSRHNEEEVKNYTVWEISSFKPFDIEKKWDIQNGIKLYKLSKQSTNI